MDRYTPLYILYTITLRGGTDSRTSNRRYGLVVLNADCVKGPIPVEDESPQGRLRR